MTDASQMALLGANVLCGLGLVGLLTRRSLILLFLSIEMILMGVVINFVTYAHQHGHYQGQIMAILVLTTAACEAALVLALAVALYRSRETLDIDDWNGLGETPAATKLPEISQDDADEDAALHATHLMPAGLDPAVQMLPSKYPADEVSKPVSTVGSREHV